MALPALTEYAIAQRYIGVTDQLTIPPDEQQRAAIRGRLGPYQVQPLQESGLCANKRTLTLVISLLAIAAIVTIGLTIAAIVTGGLVLPILAGVAGACMLAAGGYLTYLGLRKPESPEPPQPLATSSFNWHQALTSHSREQLLVTRILDPLLGNAAPADVESVYWMLDQHAARQAQIRDLQTTLLGQLQAQLNQQLQDLNRTAVAEDYAPEDTAQLQAQIQEDSAPLFTLVNERTTVALEEISTHCGEVLSARIEDARNNASNHLLLQAIHAISKYAPVIDKASNNDSIWESICDEMSEFITVLPKLVLVELLSNHSPRTCITILQIPETHLTDLQSIQNQLKAILTSKDEPKLQKEWIQLIADLCGKDNENTGLIREIGLIYNGDALPKPIYAAFRAAIDKVVNPD